MSPAPDWTDARVVLACNLVSLMRVIEGETPVKKSRAEYEAENPFIEGDIE